MKAHHLYYRVDRRQICFIRFILEAYDGLAMLRTLDPHRGEVAIHVARGCLDEAVGIIQDLQKSVRMEPMPPIDENLPGLF